MKPTNYVWSDAWLLLALICLKGPADRARIRHAGDFINHAIFTDEELEGGLQRLLSEKHIVAKAAKYNASPKVRRWFQRETKGKKWTYVFKDLERVEKYLGIVP